MGSTSRRKGQRGELEAASELAKVLGIYAARGRQYHGRNDAPDVMTSLNGVHFEVKYTASVPKTNYKHLEQAAADSGDAIPIVLQKLIPGRKSQRKEKWLAVMYLDDLSILGFLLENRFEVGQKTGHTVA